MKKVIVLILGFILITQVAYAGDTEISLFDEAQAAVITYELEEQKLIETLDKDIYEIWIKIPDTDSLYRKLSRIAFLERIERTDEKYWSNPYLWSDGFEGSDHFHRLSKDNSEFREIEIQYQELMREKIKYLKLTRIYQRRNELREKNCGSFTVIENRWHEEFMKLQTRMDAIKKKE